MIRALWRRFRCWRYRRLIDAAEYRGDHGAALYWQHVLEDVAWGE